MSYTKDLGEAKLRVLFKGAREFNDLLNDSYFSTEPR